MYRLNIKKGLFLCPSVCKGEFVTPYKIGDNDATIEVIGLSIPQNEKKFDEFCKQMHKSEEIFFEQIKQKISV